MNLHLHSVRLPDTSDPEHEGLHLLHYRHWLTFADGRIYYQDETLRTEWGKYVITERTDWQNLPVPPVRPGLATVMMDSFGQLIAARTDGAVMRWNTAGIWESHTTPLPGTPAEFDHLAEMEDDPFV